MAYKVVISPINMAFVVEERDGNILNAALAANINLPHGCKNGDCSSCLCKISNGSVELIQPYNKTALTAEMIAQGYTLACRAIPKTDIRLDMPEFNNNVPIKALPAKIESISKIGTVAIIKLKLPGNQEFKYEPGQYINIMYEGKARSYSIANGKIKDGCIELHIRYRPEGFFSEIVWHKLAANQILRIKGPMGSFNLHHHLDKVLMICTGTGFAPIKAIVEKMIENNEHRHITLVWGGSSIEDFYLPEILLAWQSKLNITIQVCLHSATLPNYYNGFVTDFVEENFIDLSVYEIYACGNPVMIEALYKLAIRLKLDKQYFYSDSFTISS